MDEFSSVCTGINSFSLPVLITYSFEAISLRGFFSTLLSPNGHFYVFYYFFIFFWSKEDFASRVIQHVQYCIRVFSLLDCASFSSLNIRILGTRKLNTTLSGAGQFGISLFWVTGNYRERTPNARFFALYMFFMKIQEENSIRSLFLIEREELFYLPFFRARRKTASKSIEAGGGAVHGADDGGDVHFRGFQPQMGGLRIQGGAELIQAGQGFQPVVRLEQGAVVGTCGAG